MIYLPGRTGIPGIIFIDRINQEIRRLSGTDREHQSLRRAAPPSFESCKLVPLISPIWSETEPSIGKRLGSVTEKAVHFLD